MVSNTRHARGTAGFLAQVGCGEPGPSRRRCEPRCAQIACFTPLIRFAVPAAFRRTSHAGSYSLLTIHYSPFTTHYSLFTTHHSLLLPTPRACKRARLCSARSLELQGDSIMSVGDRWLAWQADYIGVRLDKLL